MHIEEETIKLHCTDNDQWVTAVVTNRTSARISVIIDKAVKLTLEKHYKKPGMFVGNKGGYEFVYNVKNS